MSLSDAISFYLLSALFVAYGIKRGFKLPLTSLFWPASLVFAITVRPFILRIRKRRRDREYEEHLAEVRLHRREVEWKKRAEEEDAKERSAKLVHFTSITPDMPPLESEFEIDFTDLIDGGER